VVFFVDIRTSDGRLFDRTSNQYNAAGPDSRARLPSAASAARRAG